MPAGRAGTSDYCHSETSAWLGVRDTMGGRREVSYHRCCKKQPMELAMKCNDLSRSLVAFDQNSTLVAVVELSLNSWVAAGVVPGLGRDPVKKQSADCNALLKLLHRVEPAS